MGSVELTGGGDRGVVEGLVAAVRELSRVRSLSDANRVLYRSARGLARAQGVGLTLLEGDYGFHAEEDGLGPGWKGRRMPLEHSVAGSCIRSAKPVVIADVLSDVRLSVAPYWSGPVGSLVAVPVRSADPIGALTCYWSAPRRPTASEVEVLAALADTAAVAVEAAAGRAELERRVKERTAELEELNRSLERELGERRRAENEVRQQSLVDELTGLYNRRGFTTLAGRELLSLQRNGRRALVLYLDVDGLKQANDAFGHDAGDRLLVRAASVLRSATRQSDVAARMGGDEFAVFMPLGYDHPPLHLLVERYLEAARRAGVRWSVGATATPPDRAVTLDDLLTGADEAMYRGRRARRALAGAAAGDRSPAGRQPGAPRLSLP